MISINEIQVKELISPCNIKGIDYVINPYVGCSHDCTYCYAEFMKRFTDHQEDWGKFVDVKSCEKTLNVKKLIGKTVILSTVTDPYQHVEAKFQNTRRILEQLVDVDTHVSILTKSSLVLRDIDLFKQMKKVDIAISLNTTDDDFRKLSEPMTPSVSERINAIKELHQAGITTKLFVSPVFPYITNISALYRELKDDVDEWCFENLNLRGAYKARVLTLIKEHYPQFYPNYLKIYAQKEDNREFWDPVKESIEQKFSHISHRILFYHSTHTKGEISPFTVNNIEID